MDKKTVFVKTTKGENEVKSKGGALSGDLKRALFLVDETSTFDEISRRSAPSLRSVLPKIFEELISAGYIRDEAKPFAEQQITVPKAVKQEADDELDFTSLPRASVQNKSTANFGNQNSVSEAQAKAKQEAEEARALAASESAKLKEKDEAEAKRAAELEAIAKQEALLKAQAETKAKNEAEARMRAEHEAAEAKLQLEAATKAKAEAEAIAKQEAEANRIKAEEALRIKIEQEVEKAKAEAKLKAEEEARAHALAEEKARKEAEAAKLKAEQEAAKIKAELEAAKAKVEAEQAARARALAEEKTRLEAEAARQKADQEARRIKAEEVLRLKIELEVDKAKAEAKLKAETEAKARALAEEKARKEAEAAKLKADQETARIKAELEAAKAKAEAEAKARVLAEEKAKKEAEVAKLKADQEAAKIKAELEVAKAKAEAEAKALAEERAKQEAARLKAEQEAVKMKAELEAAKAKAEAQTKALAEERAKQEAERLKAEQESAKMEAAKIKAEAEAKANALAEEAARKEAEIVRLKAEQEAIKIQTELEAAKTKTEAEANAKALAEETAKKVAEIARIKAEEVAAKIKAEMEAKVRAEVEARARALAEERTRQESARKRAEAEAEARAIVESRSKQELEAANLRASQDVERIKADVANLANSFHEPASYEHEVAFNRRIADSQLEADRASLERKIAEQEIAIKKQNEEANKLAEEQAKAWAAAEQRANELARAEASRPVYTAHVKEDMHPPIAKVRKNRKPLPVGKIIAGLFVVVVLLIWLLPNVVSLKDYIAPIEKQLTAQFKQPVHISVLRAETLLWPKLQLEQVTIGSAQEIKVGKALLTFDPFSLFSPVKTIRSLELQDVSVDGVSLEKVSAWMQEIGSNTGYQFAHVAVRRIKMLTPEIELPLFDADIELTGQGRVEKVTLRSADEKFVVNLHSDQNKWQITFNAKGAFPLLPNVLFDDFSANGEIASPSVNFTTVDAQAYGGFFHGNAKLSWQKGWQLQGRIGAKSVELVKLFPKYGVSGEVQGDYNFSFSGNKLAQIADVQQLDGSFVVSKAVINNMDMVETVRQGNRQIGRTHVDELSGNFQGNSRVQHFQQLQITSGILNGSGSFDVNANSQISGHLSVTLKAREGGTSALTLSGTLSEPILNTGR